MADQTKYFQVRRIPTSGSLIPLIAPITCGQVVIQNTDSSNSAIAASHLSDTDQQKFIPAGQELTLRATEGTPWGPGDLVCYIAAAGGNGPVCVTFLR